MEDVTKRRLFFLFLNWGFQLQESSPAVDKVSELE